MPKRIWTSYRVQKSAQKYKSLLTQVHASKCARKRKSERQLFATFLRLLDNFLILKAFICCYFDGYAIQTYNII
jgi:hypothetical protein